MQRVENDILATKRQTLGRRSEYRQHIDALNAEANRHLAEVQRIEEAKRQLSMSTEERIRDIRRQGMTEYEATEDRKRQIAEMQEQARRRWPTASSSRHGSWRRRRWTWPRRWPAARPTRPSAARTPQAVRAGGVSGHAAGSTVARGIPQAGVPAGHRFDAAGRSVARGTGAEGQGCRRAGRAGQTGRARPSTASASPRKSSIRRWMPRPKAHQTAARSAITARDEIQRTLTETTRQIDDITAKLKDGLKVTLDADTTRFDKAIADLDKALAEKEYLLQIQADLQEAEKKLKEYEQLLKEGKTLPVDADVSKAKEALDRLKTYADQNAQFELKVATEKAQAAITNVEGMIKALDRIQTESRHQVASNAGAVRAEIDSLNGRNTSSTHTIYVTKVETNATGGLGVAVRRFADGGAVAPAFPRMSGGSVPWLRPPRHRAAHPGCRGLRDPQGGGAEVRQRRALASGQWRRPLRGRWARCLVGGTAPQAPIPTTSRAGPRRTAKRSRRSR